jgi:lipopolysaccharide/colanic/teichoic acid biosynthesis glycosyltransferase
MRAKYVLDRVLSGLMLLFLSPVLAMSALAVALSLGRPILFRQKRVGLDGTEFDMLKFRTLAEPPQGGEGDAGWAAEQLGGVSVANEAPLAMRLTPVGWFLRRHCLDELPQLWNVLRGDMSLVGPRPCIPYETSLFEPHHFERFLVPAGLTGLWQVMARSRSTFVEALDFDVAYARGWSFGLDLRLLARTPLQIFRDRGTT